MAKSISGDIHGMSMLIDVDGRFASTVSSKTGSVVRSWSVATNEDCSSRYSDRLPAPRSLLAPMEMDETPVLNIEALASSNIGIEGVVSGSSAITRAW